MMKRIVLAVALCAAPTFAADLPIREGMPYDEARAALVNAKWRPVPQPETPGRCSGLDDICEKYPEVEDCAGSGSAPCAFVFERSGDTVRVGTIGEELVVSGWQIE